VAYDFRPPPPDADELTYLLYLQDGVISRRQALRYLSDRALRHRLMTGRWQVAHRGIYIAHSGPPSRDQRRWLAVLAAGAGRRGILAGVSALEMYGMRGYASDGFHVLMPAHRRDHNPPPGVVVHRTRVLAGDDLHRAAMPPCTMPARSVVDAAHWASSDDRARAVVAAAFQQRLVSGAEVANVLARLPRVRRRALIAATAADAATGTHSVPEAEFLRLCRRGGLPIPTRQAVRVDARGRRRWLDAYFEEWKLHVEIDGGQHTEVRQWWADMRRQNDLWVAGVRVLRFPAWVVRDRPTEVVDQVRAALTAAGWRSGW
jgi:Protein of unknown function (DUF559)